MRIQNIIVLLILFFLLTCNRQPSNTFFLTNINGYTLTHTGLLRFDAMAVEDGKIVYVGPAADFANSGRFKKLDGKGQTVLPGLIDAHAHVVGLGRSLMEADLMGSITLDETLLRVKVFSDENPNIEWIGGRGWNQTRWPENAFPAASDLDRIISDRPVWLRRVDGHAAWANTKALEIAGINKETADPPGGTIIRDAGGNATGVFIDRAMYLVERHIPPRSSDYDNQALERALESIRRHGLTGVHDAGTGVADWNLFKSYADEGKMTTRIYGMISGAGEIFDTLAIDGPVHDYANHLLALRSVKLYSDGALGSRGAALIEPYTDDPGNSGLLFNTSDEFYAMFNKVSYKGFQVGIHAIGDQANRTALDAFTKLHHTYGDQGLRHRIEHAQVVYPGDISRFKDLNIIASMQPVHATSDMNMAEFRVGAQRIRGAYAWQTYIGQNTIIAGGSDFPVEKVNPMHGLFSAVSRTDFDGNPIGGWYPEHKLSREEALRIFTMNAAYAAHLEDLTGSLEPGKYADFIVIDLDYFEIPESDIWKIRVLETWVAGDKVFEAGSL